MVSIISQIYCFQTDTVWEDVSANYERLKQAVAQADPERGSLLVFPELSTSGFTMDTAKTAETADGPSTGFFSGIASTRGCSVVGGIPIRDESGDVTNSAVCFGPDGAILGRYNKMRPFPLVGEEKHYTAGTDSILFDWNGWKVAPFVCYDLRFPELFRMAAIQGAEVFVVIANWPSKRVAHWTALLRARAIENQAYVFGVNRCGRDPNFSFPGASVIFDPMGEEVANAGDGVEAISAMLDRSLLDSWRSEFPALTDAQ